MATLTHWNTAEVYDYGHTEDGTFYYVMEYLPGLNLQESISGCELLYRAANLRKNVVGIRPDESNGAHDNDENDGQHDGVFRDVLALFIIP